MKIIKNCIEEMEKRMKMKTIIILICLLAIFFLNLNEISDWLLEKWMERKWKDQSDDKFYQGASDYDNRAGKIQR